MSEEPSPPNPDAPVRTVRIPTPEIVRERPRPRPFDPAPFREWVRTTIVGVFLFLLAAIVVGMGYAFIIGRLREESLLTIISTVLTLLGSILGFYFGQESAKR